MHLCDVKGGVYVLCLKGDGMQGDLHGAEVCRGLISKCISNRLKAIWLVAGAGLEVSKCVLRCGPIHED